MASCSGKVFYPLRFKQVFSPACYYLSKWYCILIDAIDFQSNFRCLILHLPFHLPCLGLRIWPASPSTCTGRENPEVRKGENHHFKVCSSDVVTWSSSGFIIFPTARSGFPRSAACYGYLVDLLKDNNSYLQQMLSMRRLDARAPENSLPASWHL